MPDEQLDTPVESSASDTAALQAELEAMRRKNQELLNEKKQLQKKLPDIPDGVDVQELLEFKRKVEQQQLESKGQYQDALKTYEQQFRDREASYQQQIDKLQGEVRNLRLDSRVVAKLADQVHDPADVLRLHSSSLTLNDNGDPVYKDGYQELPIDEWMGQLQQQKPWLFKAPKPQGTGAPAGSRSTAVVPAGMKNPFSPEHYNLTEQGRLFKTNPDLYAKLKSEAKR
jgi:FtsZ-binding cell division protein ZapB